MVDQHAQRVFSGIQPTGSLHIGNYIGAVQQFVDMQYRESCFFCIADMHALTVKYDAVSLKQSVYDTVCLFLACGINPNKATIFIQSHVSAHAELAWILSCVARIGWLNRMTQFKEKAGKNAENVSVGLYTYPVLMAADVLAYKATDIPVGDDQIQHVELIRDIVARFNQSCGKNVFPSPKPIVSSVARIMSLRDGTSKMSKSDPSDYSRINLLDSPDLIEKKIRKAKTDSGYLPESIGGLEGRPEAENLLRIYSFFTGLSIEDAIVEFSGLSFSVLKDKLVEVVIEKISPVRQEFIKLHDDINYIDSVIGDGAISAGNVACKVLSEVYDVVGVGSLRRG